MKYINNYIARCVVLIAIAAGAISCSGDTENSAVSEPKRITGTIVNEVNGAPVRDAVITTLPPTEQVTTSSSGTFLIEDFTDYSGSYEVSVRHTGYLPKTALVATVPGTTATVNFTLESTAAGLITNKTLLQFPPQTSSNTFLLTSTVEQTTFSIQSTAPWVSVFPSEGVISSSEIFIITVSLDTASLPNNSPLAGQLVINTDNGSDGVIINIQVDTTIDDSSSLLGNNQSDCRRPDVIRLFLDDTTVSLIQFPESIVLPDNAGPRFFQLPTSTPVLFDSLIVRELGEVTITHVAGATDDTSIEIFDMSAEEEVRELDFNIGQSDSNRRASLKYAVEPGIYCYYLGPTVGMFSLPANLELNISFRSASDINELP